MHDVGVDLDAGQPADGGLEEIAALGERRADEGHASAEGVVLRHRRCIRPSQLGDGVARNREEASGRTHVVDPPELPRPERQRRAAGGQPGPRPPVREGGEVVGKREGGGPAGAGELTEHRQAERRHRRPVGRRQKRRDLADHAVVVDGYAIGPPRHPANETGGGQRTRLRNPSVDQDQPVTVPAAELLDRPSQSLVVSRCRRNRQRDVEADDRRAASIEPSEDAGEIGSGDRLPGAKILERRLVDGDDDDLGRKPLPAEPLDEVERSRLERLEPAERRRRRHRHRGHGARQPELSETPETPGASTPGCTAHPALPDAHPVSPASRVCARACAAAPVSVAGIIRCSQGSTRTPPAAHSSEA